MYQHQPLPPLAESNRTPPYTRVLYLEPGRGEDVPFCGRLEVINLETAPPYEALSYTWGKDPPCNYIWIQGNPLPIQPNLEGALHALRLENEARCLWIDALCIDQTSKPERSRQVAYMRLVYQYTTRVVVWLGPRTDGVDVAFETARRIANMGRMIEQGPPGASREADATQNIISNTLASLPPNALELLQTLFNREYFSRVWVVQEIMVGAHPVAICGDLQMPFFELVSVLFFLGNHRDKVQVAHSLDVWHLIHSKHNDKSPVKLTDIEGSLGPLIDLLEAMRDFKATDNRDKIYSVLGICDEGIQPILTKTHFTRDTDRRLSILHRAVTGVQNYVNSRNPGMSVGIPDALKPDYEKDLVSVYTEIARYFISKSPMLLDVLSHVQHHEDPSEVGCGGYPSWVPKWFESKGFHVYRGGSFSAGICTPPLSDFRQSRIQRALAHPRHLVIDGFHLGVVQQVSDVIQFGRAASERTEAIVKIWTQLFPFPLIPRPNHSYRIGGEPLDVAFCKAISASPLGIMYGSLLTESTVGYGFQDQKWTKEILESLSDKCIHSFLLDDSESKEGKMFRNAFALFAYNRRVFITSDGRIGMGPTFMRPGDEVVVLFRGRMPYILRRQPDHHILMGDCYVRDDDIMYGRTTESVRHGRGGPPAQLYEIR